MKSLTSMLPLGLVQISNLVPRTLAVADLPCTSNVAPETRCCTLVKVRPADCVSDTS